MTTATATADQPQPPDMPTLTLAGRRYPLPPLAMTNAELATVLRTRVARWKCDCRVAGVVGLKDALRDPARLREMQEGIYGRLRSLFEPSVTKADVDAFVADRVSSFCWFAAILLADPLWPEHAILDELSRQARVIVESN